MADPEHLEVLNKGVEEWNRWREASRFEFRPDLSCADLSGVDLMHIDFSHADLAGADLSVANLRSADLTGARLSNADLAQTVLSFANLSGADLSNARLMGALLGGCILGAAYRGLLLEAVRFSQEGVDLSGANLAGARLLGSHFGQTDLSEANGLEEVVHDRPSAVSSQTLELSRGQIPDKFLKGCGFPDWAILSAKLYNPNLRADQVVDLTYRIADMRTKAPIVPRSIFISYSNKDMGFIEKLEAQFDDDGIRSWRDVEDMVAGPIEHQIDRAISAQKVVLLVLSKNSIRSDWVEWEVRRARELQKDLQEGSEETVHVLCPVAIDRSWWERNPWPGRLRAQVEEYNIVDLSQWEDEAAFEPQYQKLKKGLGIYYRDEGE